MRRGVKAYFAANMVAQGVALLRFIILARLLGAEELGLAAMLILTSQFFQAISDTGSDRFLVQDDGGDSPSMQGFVQFVLSLRGLLIGLALVLFSGLAAQLYREPQLAGSLMALGLAPLIGGFIHLDFRRVQRDGDFRPESIGIIVSEVLSLVANVAAAYVTRDHTSVVYGLVVRSLLLVIISHITATRPYRWAWNREEGLRFSRFAAPLFLNGLLLFIGSQGDRLLVGTSLGATALGHYSAILLLIYYPTGVLIRFLAVTALPQLAAARGEPARFQREASRFGGRTTLMALGVAAGFALVAPIFTPIFYGKSFAQPLVIFALIGALQSARFLRVWPTTIANGIGRSMVILLNNVGRMVAVPIALLANAEFHTLEAIVIGFIGGEIVAMLVALWLLQRAGALSLRRELIRIALFLAGCTAISGAAWSLQAGNYVLSLAFGAGGLVVAAVVLRMEREVLGELITMARRRLLPRKA
ncbi:MAG: oligosaccharide flippase family protein [Phenylobacterium sp.]|uniref:oligosaccharide flippase family protein n=1 Tax=Phenylobacterium sp. TaxID=1871053 RepID=UPI001A5C58FE|nr:oligosaccharide flippase family protein [Phenylobacterium sp.]MBL8554510.1 oligosaccharide flippase family protein [Phenylobacterium sp.]